jgi:hypothetical protein
VDLRRINMLAMVKLSKRCGSNFPGEICGFSPETAKEIVKQEGGEILCEFDESEMRFDVASVKLDDKGKVSGKAVRIDPEEKPASTPKK